MEGHHTAKIQFGKFALCNDRLSDGTAAIDADLIAYGNKLL